jgi:hypothetical protein
MSGSSGWLVHRSDPIASQVELLETMYLARDDIELFSKEARQSVLKYQGEEPNKNWNQLLENLVGK